MSSVGNWQPQVDPVELRGGPIEGGPDGVEGSMNKRNGDIAAGMVRKRLVVVGLGMVGISFM